jgi:hypothetical protein
MSLPRTATGFVSDVRSGRFAMPTTWEKTKALVGRELNFYRVHLLAFIFVSPSLSVSIPIVCILMIDTIVLLRHHVRYQHRVSDPIHRLFIPLYYQYDGKRTRHGRFIDFERYAAGHNVLADAHWVFGTSSLSGKGDDADGRSLYQSS